MSGQSVFGTGCGRSGFVSLRDFKLRWVGGAVMVVIVAGMAVVGEAAEIADGEGATPEAPLDTIFVYATKAERFGPVAETHHSLDADDIELLHTDTMDTVVRRLPSAHVPTNSRGESLVYFRSAGERQVAAFFDGALLNVPWDNRFDLGVFPSAVVGRVTSATGTLSPQYGVNALGAVAFFPRERLADDSRAVLDVHGGSGDLISVNGAVSGEVGPVSLLAAAGHADRDGVRLSDNADVPFNQTDRALRTNTDAQATHVFLRSATQFERFKLAATLLVNDVERGIAPESDRSSGSRFWQFPKVQTIMGVLSGEVELAPQATLTTSVWAQDFQQTIDSYSDATYATIDDREEDKDRTYGVRSILQTSVNGASVTGSVNFLTSEHRQRDIAFVGGMLPSVLPDELAYKQNTASVGVDVEIPLTSTLSLDAGAGGDRIDYTKTGDKPGMDPFFKPVVRGGVSWDVTDRLRWRVAAGQKYRMPTMRELFGTAINRFLLNPDLQPERIRTAEMAWDVDLVRARFSTIVFGQAVKDTIDQRRVGALRQRVNLKGSWAVGAEVAGEVDLSESWNVAGSVTAVRARRKTEPGDATDRLAERPAVLANLSLNYQHSNGARAGIELEHNGRAYSADENGAYIPLEISTQLHFHGSYPLPEGPFGTNSELYLRANNVTDAFVEPQVGLPAPGRQLSVGIRFRW